jgi:molecular chaperone DnaJ
MDLYSVLGVPRTASALDIERAYRRLARQFHPGLNPGDRLAEARFRQIESAYRVLADEGQRRDYDRGTTPAPPVTEIEATVSFTGFDFSTPADGPSAATFSELFADVFQHAARRATTAEHGLEIEAHLSLAFEDAIQGGAFPLSVARQDRCGVCAGEGSTPQLPEACPECDGQGARRWARGHMVFTKDCDACGGRGVMTRQVCRGCAGSGLQPRSEVVTLHVPPGIESGARLVVPGRGHAIRQGAPGDLYVTIEIAPHSYFTRAGRDLRLTLPVAVHEAALGAKVDVPTLDGPVKLRVPPGTTSGQRFRLRGRGVPAASGDPADAGDLVIEVQIALPPVRDERSRELLREFARLNGDDVRKHLFGHE